MNLGGPDAATFVRGNEEIGNLVGEGKDPKTSPVSWAPEKTIIASSGDFGADDRLHRSQREGPGRQTVARPALLHDLAEGRERRLEVRRRVISAARARRRAIRSRQGYIAPTAARPQTASRVDLTQMNLEDLMAITVTSVSKKEQPLSRTAAAVFVINQEDIRRSGATSIPDLLRMAPGVDVQQIDASAWAISIRGFNSRYSNKVLVLIDGRTVYTPSFSGVFWDHLNMPLEDIERIEVIRGPGATVWGANAVNGVISIITKSSKETKGGLRHSRGRIAVARAR